MAPDNDAVLTHVELCKALKISRRTLDARVNDGLPRFPVGKRCFRYLYGDVIAWLRTFSSGSEERARL